MDVKEAREAASHALTFFRELQIEPNATDLRVEELEQSAEGGEWYVTLSYARPQPEYAPEARLATMMGKSLYADSPPMERDYRRLVLSAENYEVAKVVSRSFDVAR